MCEGSFLPSSFGPHQKHTDVESSLRSYPINSFAFFAKGGRQSSRRCTDGSPTRPGRAKARLLLGRARLQPCRQVLLIYPRASASLARAVPPSQTGKGLGGASNHTGEKTISGFCSE